MNDNSGQLKEAIDTVKDIHCYVVNVDNNISLDEQDIEAINTVLKEVESKKYTADDMESFAEWLSVKEYSYHPKAKIWTYGLPNRKTTEQLRELWEKEMRKKED